MKSSLKNRIGYFLERFSFLNRFLYKYDSEFAIDDKKFARGVNRINGHIVILNEQWKIIVPGDKKNVKKR